MKLALFESELADARATMSSEEYAQEFYAAGQRIQRAAFSVPIYKRLKTRVGSAAYHMIRPQKSIWASIWAYLTQRQFGGFKK